MKKYETKELIKLNIYLLLPLIFYSLYKNGYLIYEKGLINFVNIFKPIYLILIGVLIKIIIDLIRYKKINIDYDIIYVILIAMIMPYNIDYITYTIAFIILYLLSLILDKYIKYNKVCLIYLLIILINFIINKYSFTTPLEDNYSFSFSFLDLLIGRNTGGIASTSILFSLLAYIILITNYYYKKDIPFVIIFDLVFLLVSVLFITKVKIPKPRLTSSIVLLVIAIVVTLIYIFV